MAATMSTASFDSLVRDSIKSTRPIKVWSSNQAICDEPKDLDQPDSPELPDSPKLWRKKSTSYAVPGLSYDYPEDVLKDFDIPRPFWNKFIAALNAALSEYPSWKDPNSVRRKRGLSFSEGEDKVVCFGPHEPSQINQADRVLKWWNDDYFREKGCQVRLGFESPGTTDPELESTIKTKPALSLLSI